MRDPRGFAVKFYTEEGNWDLTGNNTPIFFIKDALLVSGLKGGTVLNRTVIHSGVEDHNVTAIDKFLSNMQIIFGTFKNVKARQLDLYTLS